jgi:hypothetical protein
VDVSLPLVEAFGEPRAALASRLASKAGDSDGHVDAVEQFLRRRSSRLAG